MIFPIGDTPNPRHFTPWVTWALIAVNVAIYVLLTLPMSTRAPVADDPALPEYVAFLAERVGSRAQLAQVLDAVTAWDLFIWEHGFQAGRPAARDLFASMFLHANLAHLGGNMLFLWIYGDNVEHRLGRLPYLLAWLGSGAVATLGYALLAGGALTPMVGASGAISGVLGMYFLFFPYARVRLFVFFFPFLVRTVLVSARLVLGMYLLIDNILPVVIGTQSGVAHGAHIGGFLAGLALAAAVGVLGRGRAPEAAAPSPAQAELARALALLDAGNDAAAFTHIRRGLRAHPDPATERQLRRALQALQERSFRRGWR